MKFRGSIFFLFLVFLILFNICDAGAFEKVRFVVFSDPHVNCSKDPAGGIKMDLYSVELLENTVRAINETPNLDFVLCLGDTTSDGEPWNVDKFIEIISSLDVPCYIILGNHDQSPIPSPGQTVRPGMAKTSIALSLQDYGFSGSKTWWSLDPVEGIHLAGLDTNVLGDWGGYLSEKQLDWLERDLEENKDKLTIVLGHHSIVPFCDTEKNPDWSKFYIENGQALLDIFERHPSVSFYLSGHRHLSARYVEVNGVYHIVNPSTVTYPLRYTVYELTPEYLEYEVMDVPVSEEIREMARKNFLDFSDSYWRPPSMTGTEEGDSELLKYYESCDTVKAKLPVRYKSQ